MGQQSVRGAERGTILLVVVFIATAIAGLALLGSSRVVSESNHYRVLENESQAYNDAFAQIHLAMNVVNTSAYDDGNQNLALREGIAGQFGGTVADAVDSGTTQTTTTTQGKGKKSTTTVTTTETSTAAGSVVYAPNLSVHIEVLERTRADALPDSLFRLTLPPEVRR